MQWKAILMLAALLATGCAKHEIGREDAEQAAVGKVMEIVTSRNDKVIEEAEEGYAPGLCVELPREGCIPYLKSMRDSYEYKAEISRRIGNKWNVVVSIHTSMRDATDHVEAKVYSKDDVRVPDLE